MKYLEKYTLAFPDIKIYVKGQSTNKIIQELESGEADIRIISMNINKDSLNIIKEYKIQDCFIANEKYKDVCENINEGWKFYSTSNLIK